MSEVTLIDMDEEKEISNIDETGTEESVPVSLTYLDKLKISFTNSSMRLLWFFALILFEETVFHIWSFGSFDLTYFVKVVFSFFTASILSMLVSYFPGKYTNKIINWIITVLILIIYIVNILYHSIFKVFFSIQFVDKSNVKVLQYYREIIEGLKNNWIVLSVSFFVPITILILLNIFKVLKYKRTFQACVYVNFVFLFLSIGLLCLIIPLYGKDEYSPYELVKYEMESESAYSKLGVLATEEIEIRNKIFPREVVSDDEEFTVWVDTRETVSVDEEVFGSESPTELVDSNADSNEASLEEITLEEPEPVIDTSPNILDIDFSLLAEEESNETVASIHRYMASLEPSYKNEYTGMFEGFNLIFMTAEGFSSIAVNEELTPTLYKLTHEGFVFNNFYNPRTGGSTSDGEFVCSTSLEPTNGGAKNFRIVGQNSMPFALGNIFNRTYGITSRAYHDNDFQYYGRDITYPGMGYYYQGVGNGLDIPKHWPASDLDMMKASIPEYIDDEQFNVYYMTVSGHLNYNFTGNYCSKLHYDEVKDLPYSDACKAYIGCQMELDRALEYLIAQLEEKGIADRTVICFTGDHWPYGLTNDEFSELLGHDVEETFELYKSNLILWSGAIEEPIEINKYCVSMDILPTLLNLFGFEYDSRLLMGRDILSDTPSFAPMFSKSFITDYVKYYNNSGNIEYLTEDELPEDYVKTYKKALSNKWKYSQLIMDTDYYKYICEAAGIEIEPVEQNYVPDYARFSR